MHLAFVRKDPDKAYITNKLLLPKALINERPIKTALTFITNEETKVVDEATGEVIDTIPSTLHLYEETAHHLVVPREFLTPRQREQFQFPFVVVDPPDFEHVSIEALSAPRDEEQQRAFNALVTHPNGTLNLACGKGKTVLALLLAAHLKVPTMVVVNTTALLEQWKEEIERHLDVDDVGVVQGTQVKWAGCPIVLATVHTLAGKRDLWSVEFRRRFGLVFYDEGHHMSAPLFSKSADLFYGKRYSLTATPKRLDGLEAVYQYHLGEVIYSDLSQDLVPTTFFHPLKWDMPLRDKDRVTDKSGDINSSKLRVYLGELDWRNELIVEDIEFDLAAGRQLLVLSHSVAHVDRLRQMLMNRWPAGAITGATPQESRMQILRDSNPVVGTFQLAREGLNKPSLDTLYVATPFKSPNDIQQALGRIQRAYDGKKEPIFRYYYDTAFNFSVDSYRKIRRWMKDSDYPFRRRQAVQVEFENE